MNDLVTTARLLTYLVKSAFDDQKFDQAQKYTNRLGETLNKISLEIAKAKGESA